VSRDMLSGVKYLRDIFPRNAPWSKEEALMGPGVLVPRFTECGRKKVDWSVKEQVPQAEVNQKRHQFLHIITRLQKRLLGEARVRLSSLLASNALHASMSPSLHHPPHQRTSVEAVGSLADMRIRDRRQFGSGFEASLAPCP